MSGPARSSIRTSSNGLDVETAKRAVIAELEQLGVGSGEVNWRLRDWGVSRQRDWGCPIPMIHCDACGVVPVPDDQLPVKLPDDVAFDRPGNPLDHHPTWKHVACPRCGARGAARDRHVRHLRRQLLVFRPLLQSGRRCAGGAQGGRSLAAGRSVYRRHRARDPAPAVFTLLRPRDEAHRAPGCRGAVRRAVHPGHGDARELPLGARAERRLALSGRGGQTAGRQRGAS